MGVRVVGTMKPDIVIGDPDASPGCGREIMHAVADGIPVWWSDRGVCDACGKTKDRVIRRAFGTKDKRKMCDECFEESKR